MGKRETITWNISVQNKSENPKSKYSLKMEASGEVQIPEGLFFNILPVEVSAEPVAVVFTVREDEKKHRFATSQLPESFQRKLQKATGYIPEFVYTDFRGIQTVLP